ncbi:MAG TPA: DUF1206 domain-containing protein [Streptosporangiaceae bacterium]
MPSLTYRTWRAKHEAKRAARGPVSTVLARAGLTARGLIYLLVGLVAILIAAGRSGREADQSGALKLLAGNPPGLVALWLLGLGFAAYALWQLSEAAFGVTGADPGPGPRLKALVSAIPYAGLSVLTFDVILGTGSSQAKREQDWSAKAMHYPGGRWVVGIIGIIIAIVGLVFVVAGVRATFMRLLETSQLSPRTEALVKGLGIIGSIARGLIFALAGALVVQAAVDYQPAKARGLDKALLTLRDQPFGTALLSLAALGLIVFGLYALCEARWHKT